MSALGRAALPAFTSAFDSLGAAVHGLSSRAEPNLVRIAALPSVAQLWVSPRLPMVRAEIPQLQVSLTALEQLPNPNREIFDLLLFFEPADRPSGEDAVTIAEDEILPVCAPYVADRLTQIEDLETAAVLRDSQWSKDWQRWLGHCAPGLALRGASSTFSLYSLALEEALRGGGVLIGHEPLVRRYLDDGSLVAPFPHKASNGQVLRMHQRRSGESRRQVEQVAEILRS